MAQRKLLSREEYLLRLLHFKNLGQLEKWLREPVSPDLGDRVEPAWNFHEARQDRAEEDAVLQELEDYQMSPMPN